MLFNSFQFIFIFLPVVLLGHCFLSWKGLNKAAIIWLVTASLFFYGWWNPVYLWLIIGSLLFNYTLGKALCAPNAKQPLDSPVLRKALLVLGVSANLGALAYFKYANFFVENINFLFNTGHQIERVILPLAISFFTFEQVAYLVDAYKKRTAPYHFFSYALFVTFFPQFIAGPIVHHSELIPQLDKKSTFQLNFDNLSVGLTIFILGLFKKVILADSIAHYATSSFEFAHQGQTLSFFQAWQGALSYTFQIYFDFSGYSDMAIGLGRMFNIRIPLNFHSPYKAHNIIEFWRRWHMTLSRFLRDYLYIPLGGKRKGKARRHVNLLLTMLLGGLWHGASWNFVIWGALHGAYLVINHLFRQIAFPLSSGHAVWQFLVQRLSHFLTFVAVVMAWVYFRAETFFAANAMIESMLGLRGITLPEHFDYPFLILLSLLFFIVWFFPNTQSFMAEAIRTSAPDKLDAPEAPPVFQWKPNMRYLLVFSTMAYFILTEIPGRISEFIYYQF